MKIFNNLPSQTEQRKSRVNKLAEKYKDGEKLEVLSQSTDLKKENRFPQKIKVEESNIFGKSKNVEE